MSIEKMYLACESDLDYDQCMDDSFSFSSFNSDSVESIVRQSSLSMLIKFVENLTGKSIFSFVEESEILLNIALKNNHLDYIKFRKKRKFKNKGKK